MNVLAVEHRWRAISLVWVAGLCAVIAVGFTILNLAFNELVGAAAAAASLPFLAATIVAARRPPPTPAWAPWPAVLSIIAMMTFMLHVSNTAQGGALMWMCAGPALLMCCVGARRGLAIALGVFAMMQAALWRGEHLLSDGYALRLSCAYLVVTGIVFIYERNRERATQEIAAAHEIIRTLEGMLMVCGWCHKRMRDDNGAWVSTEKFFQDRAPVTFRHGVCPSCESRLAVEMVDA